MEARDTVISRDKLDQICRDKAGEPTFVPVEKDRREAQAEISFALGEKQGIEKVIEEMARLALISDDTTLKSYTVGLLEGLRKKFPKPTSRNGDYKRND
jgi:hypothetical protein